ncbi:MAG: HAD-IB family phosphatase [Nanoarchaeota archaeon]|nr:HAD-IB family phosphatase [Nanoarchaeota archaeon]MBU1030179.1 HAD-IB family phosphatase [Nanoarchaeota archaeon]MBU1849574.1 HAD-IB family phosphatase [Nanoarchaeota archaeon]
MKYKLICFDLDGTLIDGTDYIWNTIHDNLKTDGLARDKARQDFFDGKISYQEWFEHDLKLWKQNAFTKNDLLNAIKGIYLHTGALETLHELKKRGFKIAIISGSIDLVLRKVFGDYERLFDYIFLNRVFFDDKGLITHGEHTPFDMEHKATGMRMIAQTENLPLSECVFVGDNENDVHIAEVAGFSIAFNCKSEKLAKIADVVVDGKDLRDILKFVD